MSAADLAGVQVATLAERPDAAEQMWALGPRIWPSFMMHDPVGDAYYGRVTTDFSTCTLLAFEDDVLIGRAHYIPFVHDGGALPDRGWDAVIELGVDCLDNRRRPNAASALEIGVAPEHRGRGLSALLLDAMGRHVAGSGLRDLYAPVRPSGKSRAPYEGMQTYVHAVREDGLPRDPWLRVHVRAGGEILNVCPESMRIEGTRAQWREWTGRSFSASGPALVAGALVPVVVDVGNDIVRYVEPNVWVHHRLAAPHQEAPVDVAGAAASVDEL